jgi:hypothetical protein
MQLEPTDADPFILLVHHRHRFSPWDPVRPIFRLLLPEGFPGSGNDPIAHARARNARGTRNGMVLPGCNSDRFRPSRAARMTGHAFHALTASRPGRGI